MGSSGGNCGNELQCAIKGKDFLHQFSDYQLLKEDSVQWIWLFMCKPDGECNG
jgi:hypothetical protein